MPETEKREKAQKEQITETRISSSSLISDLYSFFLIR